MTNHIITSYEIPVINHGIYENIRCIASEEIDSKLLIVNFQCNHRLKSSKTLIPFCSLDIDYLKGWKFVYGYYRIPVINYRGSVQYDTETGLILLSDTRGFDDNSPHLIFEKA